MALQIWLPLIKDMRNQGKYDLTFSNSGAVYSSTGGKLGGCYTFNDKKIFAAPPTTLKNAFTTAASIACWVKVSSSHAAWAQCVTFGTVSTTVAQIFFGIRINSSGLPYGYVGNGSTYTQCSFVTTIKDDTWHHLCLTYTTGTIKSYLDGELKTTTSTSLTPSWADATTVAIGGNSTQTFKHNDAINDVRIYNHCLSPFEVNQLSQGLTLLYPLHNNNLGQENLLSHADDLTAWTKEGSYITVEWDSSIEMYKIIDTSHTSSYYGIYQDITLLPNTTYTCSIEGKIGSCDTVFVFKESASYSSTGTNFTSIKQRLSITITTSSSATVGRIYLFIRPRSQNDYGYFNKPKVELGDVSTPWCPNTEDSSAVSLGVNGAVEFDYSGCYNDGERIGYLKYTSDTPKYAVSTTFESTSSIVSNRTYDKTATLSDYTIAVWIKAPTSISADSYFYKGLLDLFINSSNKLKYSYQVSTNSYSTATISPALEGWNHIVVTYNGTATIYINGESKATTTSTLYPRHVTDVLNYEGSFIGSLSDFRIYSTALSADEVKFLYENCMTIDPDGTVRGKHESNITIDTTAPIIGVGQIGYAVI